MRSFAIGVLPALLLLLINESSLAAISGLQRVASGLSSPIFVTHAPGDRDRLFIVERGSPAFNANASAAIRILNLHTGVMETTAFLTIPGIDTNGEGGLLGMAFHPGYQSNGKFYVYLTAADSVPGTFFSSYVREYTVSANPNIANTAFTPIMNWGQPQQNHNAGWIGFSPNDGYLYISSGDGGGSNDSGTGHNSTIGNAQDTSVLLGKMLRIDVNSDGFSADANRNYAIPSTNPFADVSGAAPEIWAYGLRNPFRDSFDRLTGDLWIGDVGQNAREEIDFQPASSTGGENYGWRLREGSIQTPGSVGGTCTGCIEPVYDYAHVGGLFGGIVVTGGYVYRGPDPSLQGKYFFLDSRNTPDPADDNYWMANTAPFGSVTNINSQLTRDTGLGQFPVLYGEDAVGNLYIAYLISGEVYRIATNQLIAGDYDADGDVDAADYNVWRATFGTSTGSRPADGNGNGVVDAADYVIWRKNLGASLHSVAGGEAEAAVPEPMTSAYIGQALALSLIAVLFRRRLKIRGRESFS